MSNRFSGGNVTQHHNYGAIVMMGASGSGKSTVGRLLANRLNCAFIEGDNFHSADNIAKMQSGIPLSDENRWPWLQSIGQATRSVVAESGTAVVSCSALKKSYRDHLASAIEAPVLFVLLEVNAEELTKRMQIRTGHFMPTSLIATQLALLERPTATEGALLLNADRTPNELCDDIITFLNRRS